MASELERKRSVVKHQMRAQWANWAGKFSPIENPKRPGAFKFDQDDRDIIESADSNCLWLVYYPYGQNDIDYLYIAPGFSGFDSDTFNGYLITEHPWNEDLSKNWDGSEFFMMPVHAVCYCEEGCSEDPDCSFCQGAEVLTASVIEAE
jgi:hypothetical protein